MMRSVALSLTAACLLAACDTAPERLTPLPVVTAQERIPSKFASLEVAEISLPAYAARNEIASNEDGTLVVSEALWADEPTRGMTLALTRNLAELTRARVASEPWPFEDFAAARIEVRVEQLIYAPGALTMSGQYFVIDQDAGGRDHAHLFSLSTPIADTSSTAIAGGVSQIIADLAREIARNGL